MLMKIVYSILLFVLAGLCEIGGGYLIWLWLRENKPWWFGAIGGIILIMYGIVATWQPANFGRVYAAYGGVFIIMAILWGWKVDGFIPDRYDIIINTGVILAGILVLLTQSKYPDLIIGAIVFLIVVRGAFRILKLGK